MLDVVTIALSCGVVACIIVFRVCGGRVAVLIALIGGWVLLPVGDYPATVFRTPVGTGGSMHALAIPGAILVNKATATALGCLVGAMLFDWPPLARISPAWFDLPIAAWCSIPVASALANGSGVIEGIAQSRYLVMTWAIPYVLGRAYLVDSEALRRLAFGFACGGLLCVPACLVEIARGPFLYDLVYGAHPYRWEGSVRSLGSRPLVFQEHGNQLGMWMATAAVAMAWLWRFGGAPARLRPFAGPVAGLLVTTCLACQSHGAIGLMLVALAALPFLGRSGVIGTGGRPARQRWVAALTLGLCASIGALAVAWVASDPGARRGLADALKGIGKGSFTWRMARSNQFLSRIAERPILGWARADWSAAPDHAFVNPINLGLWLLATGMYGGVGLLASTAGLATPVLRVSWRLAKNSRRFPGDWAATLTAVLLAINLGDSLLNSGWIIPLIAGAGGLNTWCEQDGGSESSGDRPAWSYDRTTGLFRQAAGG